MARRRRKSKSGKWVGRALDGPPRAARALPAAALDRLAGPGQPRLDRARRARPIYIADNGIHADIVMPVEAQGLDWSALPARERLRSARPADARWIAFGSGEQRVYLDTPTWWDITPRHDLVGARRRKARDARRICVRPILRGRGRSAFGRRSIAVCGPRSAPTSRSTRDGRPQRIDHPGYGPSDAFYRATGKASALRTCNTWVAAAGCGSPV